MGRNLPVRIGLAALLVVGLFVGLSPTVSAAPTILPLTDSLVAVDADDFFLIQCEPGSGATFTLVGPSGEQLTLSPDAPDIECEGTSTPTTCAGFAFTFYASFNLNGDRNPGTTAGWSPSADDNLIGSPGDGTWTLNVRTPLPYRSCLHIDTKEWSTTAGTGDISDTCFWNWRSAGASFSDAHLCSSTTAAGDDPNNFVFFSDQAAAADPDPQGFTTDSTVACPNTATIRGLWIRGATQSSNTFAAFYHVQGIVPGDSDLRDNVGVGNTGYVDDGAGANGDHSATIGYNNAVGNSYQIAVKAGTGGTEQLGAVVFIAPGQCTPITEIGLLNAVFDELDLDIEASQAQCNGDRTEFTVKLGIAQTLTDMDVQIYDDSTGLVVLTIDDSQMRHVPTSISSNGLYFFNRTLPGGFVGTAVAIADPSGIGIANIFDGDPFNVPRGTCVDSFSPTNLEGICSEEGNCAATGGGDLQLMNMDVQESWTFLLFLAFLLLSLWRGWWFVGAVASLGLLMSFIAEAKAVFNPYAAYLLLIVAIWLELMLEKRRQEADGVITGSG